MSDLSATQCGCGCGNGLTSEMAATVPASGLSSCCYCAVAVAAEDSAVETVAVATMTVSGSS